jgi:hypothetical protein
MRGLILALVKLRSRLFTTLNLLPSFATLASASKPSPRPIASSTSLGRPQRNHTTNHVFTQPGSQLHVPTGDRHGRLPDVEPAISGEELITVRGFSVGTRLERTMYPRGAFAIH